MNIVRINAGDRFKMYSQLLVIIMFALLLVAIPLMITKFKHTDTIISKYSCEEIYNMSVKRTDQMKVSPSQFVIYYLENCYDKGGLENEMRVS